MRRPRLTLPLLNPRRRLRDRLLAAMLVVALVPAGALFALTAFNLRGIIEATVSATQQSLLHRSEQGLEDEMSKSAESVSNPLQDLARQVKQLAATADAESFRVSSGAPLSSIPPLRDEVYTVPVGPEPGVVLLLGSSGRDTLASLTARAGRLDGLSRTAQALGQFSQQLAAAGGDVAVTGVWIDDPADHAVLESPSPSLRGPGLSSNPQGAPLADLPASPGTTSGAQGPQPAQSFDATWLPPYFNELQGSWETSVYVRLANGLMVGADVPLAQFGAAITSPLIATGYPGSYPLLLSVSGDGTALDVATPSPAPATLAKDFPSGLRAGSAVPPPSGRGGAAVLNAIKDGEGSTAPIERAGHDVELFFTTPVDPPGWILLEAAPKADFEPNLTALTNGINTSLTDIFREAIPVLAILVIVCFLLATMLSRLVVAPVKALTVSAERLATGTTHEPVPPQGQDEVGDLAASLERMRREINASREVILAASRELEHKVAQRTAELSARNEELLALNELAGSLTRSLDPEAIVQGALDTVSAILPITAGRGFLVNRDGQLSARGPAGEEPGALLEEVAFAAYSENRLMSREDERGTLIGLALSTGGGALGALGLRSTVAPGPETTALLLAIGNQVGLALHTARLSEEGREMAVLEERARLAREIHDTLAQQLTGIVVQLEAALALAGRGPELALPALASAQELARSALAEARRSVWDLRPAPLTSTGLVAAAESEVDRFRRRTGIAARLRAERMSPPPALRPQAEVALLRITQQALANVAAHSGASRVAVRLRHLDGHVELTVKDNGQGFDPGSVPPGSFGIVGMAERVRLAGGSFEVESSPGKGTTIAARLPVTEETAGKAEEPGGRTAVPA
jgi:two-component system NarL family sensor kinase